MFGVPRFGYLNKIYYSGHNMPQGYNHELRTPSIPTGMYGITEDHLGWKRESTFGWRDK